MKKVYQIISSSALMGVLFLLMAVALAIATFVENSYGTPAARALFYNSWWFELIWALLALNMLASLTKYRVWSFQRLPGMLFHLAFLIILIGAAITHFNGFEGLVHIRQGEKADSMMTDNCFVDITVSKGDKTKEFGLPVNFSTLTPRQVSIADEVDNLKFSIESTQFIENADFVPETDVDGQPIISLEISAMGTTKTIHLERGSELQLNKITVGFDNPASILNLMYVDGKIRILSKIKAFQSKPTLTDFSPIDENIESSFELENFLIADNQKIKIAKVFPKASLTPVSSDDVKSEAPDAIVLKVKLDGVEKKMIVTGKSGEAGFPSYMLMGNTRIEVKYGAWELNLPFELQLDKFTLARYPGSNSPSSYESEVTLIDEANNVNQKHKIFMNHILDYGGYRFFQSSYDNDEQGTILSVNHDFWGTTITYLGYFLLTIGFVLALIMPNTRFRALLNESKRLSQLKQSSLLILFLMMPFASIFAEYKPIEKAEAERFGALWVQDNAGRIEPINTFTGEILRKIVKHNSFQGLTSDQMVLGMITEPEYWQTVPLITVKHPQLREIIGLKEKKASFKDFLTADGQYKLQEVVDLAYRKSPAMQDKFDQEVIKVDEQVNVFYTTQNGSFLKIFPNPISTQQQWYSPISKPRGASNGDSLFITNIIPLYIEALSTNDTVSAHQYIEAIGNYQQKYGASVLPSKTHTNVEIFYNKVSIFVYLSPYFMLLGLILIVLQIIRIISPKINLKKIVFAGNVQLLIGFLLITAGLILRWYIAGHAPWSNGYETMLYISWAVMLAGLIFAKRNDLILSVAGFFTGIVLMVAHLSWMNPEITNLVPVLQSYWLTIHVAVIVGGYGFLGLGAIIAIVNMIFYLLKNSKNRERLSLTISELTVIAEMSLTVGLYLMTIGSFLGGVWANESWGRYWGWDSKETWSLITVLVYAFVVHLRLIPKLQSEWTFNFATIVAFSSVLMTYLGVNYYLTGMHSYGRGETQSAPILLIFIFIMIILVAIGALLKEKSTENIS